MMWHHTNSCLLMFFNTLDFNMFCFCRRKCWDCFVAWCQHVLHESGISISLSHHCSSSYKSYLQRKADLILISAICVCVCCFSSACVYCTCKSCIVWDEMEPIYEMISKLDLLMPAFVAFFISVSLFFTILLSNANKKLNKIWKLRETSWK